MGRLLRTDVPFLLVVAAFVAAVIVLLTVHDSWRPATLIMAAALLAAGLARLVLPGAASGLLSVRRNRAWDVAAYLLLGAAILAADIRVH